MILSVPTGCFEKQFQLVTALSRFRNIAHRQFLNEEITPRCWQRRMFCAENAGERLKFQ